MSIWMRFGVLLKTKTNQVRQNSCRPITSTRHANGAAGRPSGDTTKGKFDRSRLRNIGIVAHINAGKTTTTERILYNAGSTSFVGDVDKGNTVTDYLVQERDRGITITSAAVTYDWRKHRINLIDTPGHVDFTIEVERSLSVLDGAVTILDASAGVEAQTITVWNQATKYQLPNIIFLNKYDKGQADYKMCLKDISVGLDMKANLIQLPVKKSPTEFSTIIDLIHRNCITWKQPESTKGGEFDVTPLLEAKLDTRYLDQVEEAREKLINNLTDFDEELASHVIECDKIGDVSGKLVSDALRRATLDCKFSPVLVGSSFKYIGVQQLMDAIVDYLPSPIEREAQIREKFIDKELGASTESYKDTCAFIFKIMHDKRLGALNYVRVYNGTLKKLQRLHNLETNRPEQVKKIHRAFADELREINDPVEKDDIVVLTGLQESRTGDILVDQNSRLSMEPASDSHSPSTLEPSSDTADGGLELIELPKLPFSLLNGQILVPKINRLEPVYFCSIEAPTVSQQLKLEHALGSMAREDPSFTFEIDQLGVTTIRGMGKLHLEVARDRIESEYGINSLLGPLQISYRETIEGSATEELSVNRLINSVNNAIQIKLYVRSKPNAGPWTGKQLRLDTSGGGGGGDSSLSRLRHDHRKAIELGLMSALSHGPSLGYPMIDCDILLLEFKANYRCGLPVISSAASRCLMAAISRCSPVLLEPIMLLEVVAPKDYNGLILSDLQSTRRGLVLATQARTNGSIVIRSKVPLATLTDYCEFLRINTSGRATFAMELHSYSAMSELDKQSLAR